VKFQEYLISLDSGPVTAVFAVIIITLAAISFGLMLIDLLKLKFRHPAYRLGAAFAPGFASVSLMSLIMGTIVGYRAWMIWLILSVMAVAGLVKYYRVYAGAVISVARNNVWTMLLLIVTMLYFLGSAFLFPGSWDEVTYQVTLPLRWSQLGQAAVFEDLPYSGFPAAPQLVNTMLISIGGILTPRLMQWVIYLLLFWSLIVLVRRSGRLVTFAFAACFILAPVNLAMLKDVYSEPWMLLSLTSGIMLTKGRSDGSSAGKYVLLGICSGFAVAVKLTGAAIALVLLTIAAQRLRSNRKVLIRSVFTLGIVAGGYAFFFYLRPWILTGNPLYPYFGWIFGDAADAQTAYYHHAMGNYKFGLKNVWGFFTLPILVAYKGGSMFDGIIFGAQFIVLLLMSILYSIQLFRDKRVTGVRLVVAAILFYAFWFFTSQQSRFLMPLFIIFILLSAGLMRYLDERAKRLAAIVLLAASVFGVWQVHGPFFHYKTAWKFVYSGREPIRLQYLSVIMRDPGYIQAMETLCRTPKQAKVMLIFERRGLYVPREYVIGTPFFQARFFTPLPQSEKHIYDELQKHNISFILVAPSLRNPDHLKEYNKKNYIFARMLARLIFAKKLRLVWGNKHGYNLFMVVRNKCPEL
jgi:hypothetical protein